MKYPVDFVFCLHDHQPVGNYHYVVEELYQKSYLPTLKLIERFPKLTVCLHHSGCLLEWLEANHPEYLEVLFSLIEQGTVSPVIGGFYEPILPTIPGDDAKAQIERMQQFYDKHIGAVPKSFWPAERVYDDGLIELLSSCGIENVLVDDQHFLLGGVRPESGKPLSGYFVTEKSGHHLNLFSSLKELRYMIPYNNVDEIDRAFGRWSEPQPILVTYGDDGEKFGGWPGTYDRVFKQGWLEAFFGFLSDRLDVIRMVSFETAAQMHKPKECVYLPSGSYEEMMVWCLSAEDQVRYRRLRKTLADLNVLEEFGSFLKAGEITNFLKKYPEVNRFQKMMLYLSKLLKERGGELSEEQRETATTALYRSQCNCAYWHGLFGGAYIGHLRDAIWTNLARVQNELFPNASIEKLDHDFDQIDEAIFHTAGWHGVVQAGGEGGLTSLCLRQSNVNVINTFGRRIEAYHMEDGAQNEDDSLNIHEKAKKVKPEQRVLVMNDGHPRFCFVDFFSSLPLNQQVTNPEQFPVLYDLTAFEDQNDAYLIQLESAKGLGKTYRITKHEPLISVEYKGAGDPSLSDPLYVELNLNLLGEHEPDRTLLVNGKRYYMDHQGREQAVNRLRVRDDLRKFEVEVVFSSPTVVFFYPCVTLSTTEASLSEGYQHTTCLVLPTKTQLEKGFKVDLQLHVISEV